MSILKKLAGQTAIYGLPTIIGRLLNYLLVPLYTYNFTKAEYGTVNELYAYVSFLNIILTYGMETALFNFSVKKTNKEEVYSTILSTVLTTSISFILLFTLFSKPIAELIRYPDHPEWVTWFALILGLDAITAIVFVKLREQNKAKTFASLKLLNIASNIFFNLFFLWFCADVYENPRSPFYSFVSKIYSPDIRIGYVFISNVIATGITFLALLPTFLKIKWRFDPTLIKEILPYSLPLLVAGLAGMTNETLDRILLKYFLPEDVALAQVGVYGACYKLSLIMTIFIQAYRFAAEPFFFAQSVEKDARSNYARVMNYFIIVCMVIFLFTMLNLHWIQYFIGKDFREALHVVPILLMANFCLGVYFNLSVWYKLTGKTMSGAYISIAGAVVTIVLNVVLIPRIGYLGSAWATLICYAFMMVVSYVLGQRYYRVPYRLVRAGFYIGLALVIFAFSRYVLSAVITGSVLLTFVNLILFLLYVMALWKMEAQRIKKMF